ncbi:hypothetical protein B0H17DRAFT_1041064 [Mycena rosella]|uniref:Uncharacterized protein n=1 Tax=Mycena rosella TaxID=1033263 RepID=A0AAD7DYW4_MYCRO|nr:hypothetical protein B0H17DRAFT_1041064 [Mycena rosella]
MRTGKFRATYSARSVPPWPSNIARKFHWRPRTCHCSTATRSSPIRFCLGWKLTMWAPHGATFEVHISRNLWRTSRDSILRVLVSGKTSMLDPHCFHLQLVSTSQIMICDSFRNMMGVEATLLTVRRARLVFKATLVRVIWSEDYQKDLVLIAEAGKDEGLWGQVCDDESNIQRVKHWHCVVNVKARRRRKKAWRELNLKECIVSNTTRRNLNY